jgi:hypothetical protein
MSTPPPPSQRGSVLMPLKSRHFSGEQRLQACLVQDSAHVKPGDRGSYVLKIQQAVVVLTGEAIPISELQQMTYGTGTAAAVLSYKRQNAIVNYSYQTSADDIVGKMTIQALDEGMAGFEALIAFQPPAWRGPHARSPMRNPGEGGNAASAGGTPLPVSSDGNTDDAWEAPVSGWPKALRDTLERSNAARTGNSDYLMGVIPDGDGRKTLKELSKLLAASPATPTIRAVYDRMRPFGVWYHIDKIRQIFDGSGSRGFFCEPVNHDSFLRDMKVLTQYRNAFEMAARVARFCQDLANCHGPRDSFREFVFFGPGLHICVTQPAERMNWRHPCDIHIDTVQQGQRVGCGYCVPLVDLSTVAHIISVSPYFATSLKKQALDYLRNQGAIQ